jgi:hypothetical protein
MQIHDFFYKLFSIDRRTGFAAYRGTAFSIVPGGGLLTCRHVVDIGPEACDKVIAVLDDRTKALQEISQIMYPSQSELDLAFLPNALESNKKEYFPMLNPPRLTIGEEVYSFGFYAFGGQHERLVQGYFSGRIVNIYQDTDKLKAHIVVLPYPVIEGMSGSPVLTYHNGPKVVGICCGSQQQRIVASEVLEYRDTEHEYKETVNRVVEFGLAYHSDCIIDFLNSISVKGFLVSEKWEEIPGLAEIK